jgi:hypothetical protein
MVILLRINYTLFNGKNIVIFSLMQQFKVSEEFLG